MFLGIHAAWSCQEAIPDKYKFVTSVFILTFVMLYKQTGKQACTSPASRVEQTVGICAGGLPYHTIHNVVWSLSQYTIRNDSPLFCEYDGHAWLRHVVNPVKGKTQYTWGPTPYTIVERLHGSRCVLRCTDFVYASLREVWKHTRR